MGFFGSMLLCCCFDSQMSVSVGAELQMKCRNGYWSTAYTNKCVGMANTTLHDCDVIIGRVSMWCHSFRFMPSGAIVFSTHIQASSNLSRVFRSLGVESVIVHNNSLSCTS